MIDSVVLVLSPVENMGGIEVLLVSGTAKLGVLGVGYLGLRHRKGVAAKNKASNLGSSKKKTTKNNNKKNQNRNICFFYRKPQGGVDEA